MERELWLTNSMSGTKQIFVPKEAGKVGMYVCGITAYDLSHIGHARAAVVFDVLFRYLKYLGYEVTYVRNFTDVDDKIIKRANEGNENPIELSDRYCQEYLKDMDDLQCLRPTHQPRVSDHIEEIKDMINEIIKNDSAYTVDGDVYFGVDAEKFPDYGRLSGQRIDQNRAGERVAADSRKHNYADFALWKAVKPGEPSWDSPWGPGRPGWHIECSAMSAKYLSYNFDIHGGGMDLIFPHHENEIVQSYAACQESSISYWIHNGHVVINKEKMSKSLGNFFTIREITERYHPLALRYFLMSTHYRSQMNYSIAQLEISSNTVFSMYQTLQDSVDAISPYREESLEPAKPNSKPDKITVDTQECINKLRTEFETKMSDDLQTAPILSSGISEALRFINSNLNTLKKKLQKQQLLSTIKSLVDTEKVVKEVLDVLGLLSISTYSEVLQQMKEKALKRAELTEIDVSNLIEERALARKNKDFTESDRIRTELEIKGISLMDIGSDTVWRPCVPPEHGEKAEPVPT